MKAKKKEIKKFALADLGGLSAGDVGRGFRHRRSSGTRRFPNARVQDDRRGAAQQVAELVRALHETQRSYRGRDPTHDPEDEKVGGR